MLWEKLLRNAGGRPGSLEILYPCTGYLWLYGSHGQTQGGTGVKEDQRGELLSTEGKYALPPCPPSINKKYFCIFLLKLNTDMHRVSEKTVIIYATVIHERLFLMTP